MFWQYKTLRLCQRSCAVVLSSCELHAHVTSGSVYDWDPTWRRTASAISFRKFMWNSTSCHYLAGFASFWREAHSNEFTSQAVRYSLCSCSMHEVTLRHGTRSSLSLSMFCLDWEAGTVQNLLQIRCVLCVAFHPFHWSIAKCPLTVIGYLMSVWKIFCSMS
jgi:hypothetical protein